MNTLPYTPIKGVIITLFKNGKLIAPRDGYILGILSDHTEIMIEIKVPEGVEHRCFTLDHKMNQAPKAAVKPGVYQKKITVTRTIEDDVKLPKIAGWPCNMVVLEISGKAYNIGLICQNGCIYFHIAQQLLPIEFNDALPIGTVMSSNPFRGTAVINIGKYFEQARIHYSNMPYRNNFKVRFVIPGEVIVWKPEDLVELPANAGTNFQYEVKNAEFC